MNKKITKLFSILLLVCMLFTSVFTFKPVDVSADDNLDAQLLLNVLGYISVNNVQDPIDRVALKLWSIGKVAGMTDEECAGMIDNALGESGLNPANVEGWQSLEGGSYTFNNTEIDNPTKITDWCHYTIYHVFSLYNIDTSTEDAHGHVAEKSDPSKINVNASAYIMDDGHFGPGLGLFQWTGGRASLLKNFAKSTLKNWYDEDLQLLFTFNLNEKSINDSSNAKWIRDHYVQNGTTTILGCSQLWYNNFEGGTIELTDLRNPEKTMYYYDLFKNLYGDIVYGMQILGTAQFPIRIANASHIIDKSLLHEIASPVLFFKQSTGYAFDVNNEADDYAREASTALLQSMEEYSKKDTVDISTNEALSKKYSLYDLFGSDIHWYRYFGESTQYPTLFDHVYSAYSQNKMSMLTLGDTIFYDASRYLSTKVYQNRQKVLTVQDVFDGKYDPRVYVIKDARYTGYTHELGSFILGISKTIVGFVSFLMGPKPMEAIRNVLDDIFSIDVWPKVFKPVIGGIVALAMVAFIFSFVGKAIKFAKGQAGTKEVFMRFLAGILSLALIGAFTLNPSVFLDVTTKIATAVDSIFNQTFALTYIEDDVIGSTDGTKTTEAMLWKTAIFEPWCIGQFGDTYDHLYTQYATDLKSNQSKMSQSNYLLANQQKDIPAGDIEYSSATYTGDVVVPVGNNIYIRNWAAYLYSCQSKYHIDQEYINGRETIPDEISFPNMKTTAYNPDIAADTFRVIDAQMNISPQIYTDRIVQTYTDAHLIENKFLSQSRNMLIYSFILFVTFMPAISQKIYTLLRMLLMGVQIIFMSIKELVKEGTGLSDIFSQIKELFFKYLLASMRLFVLISLYYILVGKSMIQTIFFCILVIPIYSLTIDSVRKGYQNVKNTYHRTKGIIQKHI